MNRDSVNPNPTACGYDAWVLRRQSEYHECCQRTGIHRFDCGAVKRREQGPYWRKR